ncbi:ABC transporter substrate-binding protein [Pseudomonas brassicacearum]|uniref:ABC transporter substrate-binding protein n=1 Tax=Pseudomonas brassicacearum subsp. neoaurantiaca TaxID=494916 RepID=A0A7V8RHX5_9PSED|nr:ABC transporter substrate-binding protein [Pseudomonas brassicacearum]MBA1376819.1 ABC transporter substrate-binding protein [Pseudomonas brassicacearum subsp. neoaurantiaca]
MFFKKIVASAGLSAALALSSVVAHAQEIKVALGTDGFVHMPLFVAVDGGFFKAKGLEVELIKFKGGGAATSGLASRSVEFCSCAIQNSINAKVKGADLTLLARMVGQYASNVVISQEKAAALGITSDTPIDQRLKAMKGLKIAVSGAGGSADFLVRFLGEKAGLSAEKDFTLLYLNSASAILTAFSQGRIDGFALSSPTSDSAILEHRGFTLLDMADGQVKELDGYPSIALSARTDWATDNSQTVKAFMGALSQATTLINEHPDQAMKLVRSRFEGTPDDVYAAAWKSNKHSFPQTPYLSEEDVARAIRFLGNVQGQSIPGTATDYMTSMR